MAISKPRFGTPINWGNPLTRGLMLDLPFNDGAGLIVHDAARYGNGSIINGGTWENGQYGPDLAVVAASQQYVSVPYNPTFTYDPVGGGSGFTVESLVWFSTLKSNVFVSDFQVSGSWTFILANSSAGGDLTVYYNSLQTSVVSGLFQANKWYHVIVSASVDASSAGFLLVFVNGVPVITTSDTIPTGGGTNAILFGSHGFNPTGNALDGKLGLARVWNLGLRAAEMQELSANPWMIYQGPKRVFFSTTSAFLPLTLGVNDTVSLSDAANLFLSGNTFFDSLFLNDRVQLSLSVPFSFSDALSLSSAVFYRLGGPAISFAVDDTFSLSDNFGLDHGIPLGASDSITLSEAVAYAVAYTLNVHDTISLTSAAQVSAVMLGKISVTDVLTLGDAIRVFITGKKAFSDSISFSDLVVLCNAQLQANADSISLSDALGIANSLPQSKTDSISLGDSVQLLLTNTPTNAFTDTITLGDFVDFDLEYVPPSLFTDCISLTDLLSYSLTISENFMTDSLSFTDDVQYSLQTSTTSYLRRYLNDVIGSSNP